jgi:hypothetical protein
MALKLATSQLVPEYGSEGSLCFLFTQITEQYIDLGTTAISRLACNSSFMNRLSIDSRVGRKTTKIVADTENSKLKIILNC